MMEITIALDKLDKIGWSGVSEELRKRNISEEGIATIERIINIQGDNQAQLAQLEETLGQTESGKAGIEELRTTLSYHAQLADASWDSKVVVEISLARGLNYYTGVIMEVTTDAVKMGSIGGGGRYDDLTGLFGVKGLSGVGVSFGIDRIYDVLEELKLFPEALVSGAKVMLINFGSADELYAIGVLQQLRRAGISAELYPEVAKFDKQMKYANKRGTPYIIIAGESERAASELSVKNMQNGEQQRLPIAEAILLLQNNP
jgi:histidyl-tRNA synthetase